MTVPKTKLQADCDSAPYDWRFCKWIKRNKNTWDFIVPYKGGVEGMYMGIVWWDNGLSQWRWLRPHHSPRGFAEGVCDDMIEAKKHVGE